MSDFQMLFSLVTAPCSAQRHLGGKVALRASTADGVHLTTYRDLERLINGGACLYHRLGVAPGQAVVLCAPNSAELVAGIVACWKVGAIAIPVDFRITEPELSNITAHVGAAVLITDKTVAGNFNTIRPSALDSLEGDATTDAADPDQPALVILTSGTTGVPKGAVHDLGSLLANLDELSREAAMTNEDSALLPLPVSHILGLEVTLAGIMRGGTIIFENFVPETFSKAIASLRPTIVVGVPSIYGAFTSLPLPHDTFASVRTCLCGGAPLPESVAEAFQSKFATRITQGYGSTETKIITLNTEGPVMSVGRAVPSTTIEIVDDSDNPLPAGEQGEIRISGPMLMKGYLGQPEITDKVLHHGHYHTGDIGYIQDGYVFISGRSKEMIIVAGNKVFPAEVESVLRRHSLAVEIAVIGQPHRRLGQTVKAIVVISDDRLDRLLCGSEAERKAAHEELSATFREYARNNLKRELRPMEWEFRPASCPLPKTNTGKIDKKQLEATAAR